MVKRLALQQRDVPAGFDEIFEGLYHLNAGEEPKERGLPEGLRLMAGSRAIQICSNL
jgi:hypothetical protein